MFMKSNNSDIKTQQPRVNSGQINMIRNENGKKAKLLNINSDFEKTNITSKFEPFCLDLL